MIAYPTEAVFGLGCDPLNPAAAARILAAKRRPVEKGLIVIAHDVSLLGLLVELDHPRVHPDVAGSWPGPVTWLIPARPGVPAWLCGRHRTLAVRVTAHPIAAGLCRAFGAPIVSTSANRTGKRPAISAFGVRRAFGTELDMVLSGPTGGERGPTRIRDGLTGEMIRDSG